MPAIFASIVLAGGFAALAAWYLGYSGSGDGVGPIMMLPLTAAAFMLGGASLLIGQRRNSRAASIVSRIFALATAGIGLFVLFEYGSGLHYGIDMLWFPAPEDAAASRRVAVNTALSFVLFGQGMLFLDGDRRARGLKSQVFATLTLIVAFVAIIGHVFDVRDFYDLTLLSGMAVTTAISFLLLGSGLLFSQLDRGVPALIVDDGAAGFVARRLFPGALLVPFLLAFFGVIGEERGILGQRLGGSLVAVADMVVFLLLIAWSARVVREVDRKRGELFVLEREARAASERARKEAEDAVEQAQAARAIAESANGAKSDFLAVMSHELRTPLAAIMGYQELLADGITGPITEAQGQQLGRIKLSARHLLSLIDEILTFTRLDAGRETIAPEEIDLHEALRGAVEIVEPLAETKKLELRLTSPGPGVRIETDPTKLRQILVNLLSNAVKFTEEGRVSLEAQVVEDQLQIAVSDTGIGIQPEHINKIFDPFWQVEQKATRRATGTGLGLTVTRRLANLLGGDVSVASSPGEGTTFSVTLPTKVPPLLHDDGADPDWHNRAGVRRPSLMTQPGN
jgi:signal transduction histidine kinase